MLTKLEVYGIAIAVFLLLLVGGFYAGNLHGRFAEKSAAVEKQEKANEIKITAYAGQLETQATADALAAQKSRDVLAALNQGIEDAHKKLVAAAMVAVNDRGCPGLTDTARLRWDAIEFLPTEPVDDSATDETPEGMQTGPVHAPR